MVYDVNGISVNHPTQAFRVCTFNVGNFSMGESGDPAGTDEMYNHFLETFRLCRPMFYMFSEWDKYWVSGTESASVFGDLKQYHSTYVKAAAGGYAGQMIYSDVPLIDEVIGSFDDSDEYYYIDNPVMIFGKEVHLICTHFTWKTQAARQAQIQKIQNYISSNNIQYYIYAGDFNLGLHRNDSQPQDEQTKFQVARQDVNLIESTGAVSVQGGFWGCKDRDGFLNTAGSSGWDAPNINMFDDIVVSPNIRIVNVDVVVSEASDHNALFADLILL